MAIWIIKDDVDMSLYLSLSDQAFDFAHICAITPEKYKIAQMAVMVAFVLEKSESTSFTVLAVDQYHHQRQPPVNKSKANIVSSMWEL